jgi:outer membrane protein assembly factor BamB
VTPAVAPAPAPAPVIKPVSIAVTATPADAEVVLNGKVAGTGSYTASVNPGDSITLVIRHEGYAAKTLAVTAKSAATYPVQLEPMPIEASFAAGGAALVGAVQVSGDVLVAADRQGGLVATNRQGRVLWKIATKNAPNENSSPVVGTDHAYFTGSKEFLVVALKTGAVVSRTALDSATTHLFGQRVAVSSSVGVYPTSTSLTLFNPATGATVQEIPIAGGTLMTPAISDGRLLVVSQTGIFFAIDATSGQVLFQVPTGASQPVASSVLVSGTQAYFADRKGLLVAMDLDAHKVLWKVPLKGQGTTGVFQDLEKSASGVFAFAGNTIYAQSAADGSELFPPITGASTPPLYHDGKLYFGTQSGTLVAVDEKTGKTVKSLDLKTVLSTRPQSDGPRLLLGSSTGQVLVVYPDSIQ